MARANISLTVDIVLFTIRERRVELLLIKRRGKPFAGRYALPGGFVEEKESLDAAAVRELREETGMDTAYLEQLYTFGEPKRDPRGRMVTVAYYGLAPYTASLRAGTDAAEAGWFPVTGLPLWRSTIGRLWNMRTCAFVTNWMTRTWGLSCCRRSSR